MLKMDRCPTCDRELSRLAHYPLIYLVSFERIPLPSDIVFPLEDTTIFLDPDTKVKNGNKIPPELADLFRQQQLGSIIGYRGWKWQKVSFSIPPGLTKEKSELFSEEGENPEPEIIYMRRQDDCRSLVLQYVNPYLDTLECLVGKEVRTEQVLPHFNGRNQYSIPGTTYSLDFFEQPEANKVLRHAEIVIEERQMDRTLATIARLEYEGRVLTNPDHSQQNL